MIRITIAALALFAAACSRESAPAPDPAPVETDAAEDVRREGRDAIGRLYHYVRSNQNGSEAEDVHVFRKRRDSIEVYKAREKCENAALVTAELDMENGYATTLVGGRLAPDGTQQAFATLTYDAATKDLKGRVELPGEAVRELTVRIEDAPWHLYDFDFASLTVMTPHLEPRADFAFGLPLVINDLGREDWLQYLGLAEATYRQDEERGGRPAHRYILGGPAFGSYGGSLWIDAEDGHLLEVDALIPNHIEYENFKLELVGVEDGGETAWAALLREHFEGCGKESP